jgi:ATP-dependent Lon protease
MVTIVRTKKRLPLKVSGRRAKLPILPLRTGVLFPGSTTTVSFSRSEDVKLVKHGRTKGEHVIACYSPLPSAEQSGTPVCQIGTVARIRDVNEAPDGLPTVTLEGVHRAAIHQIVPEDPFPAAMVDELESTGTEGADCSAEIVVILETATKIIISRPTYSPEHLDMLRMTRDDPSLLADRVASLFHFPLAWKQELLETVNLQTRLELLLSCLSTTLSSPAAVRRDNALTRKRPAKGRDNHQLAQQSGDNFSYESDASRTKRLIESSPHLPAEVVARATIEADRLTQLPRASAEYGSTKSYLDWLLTLPWGKCSPEDYRISDVEKILSSEYYGPLNLKEQILQRLSVRKLQGGADDGPTLCLIGAPGTGKASLAKAIAHALGKELIRISVGGISDVADIKGTPRTFLTALPGKIMRSLRDGGTCDPVVLIEDIDYFNLNNDASVNMALLEVIDTRRNSRFLDNYLGVPFDLSKVFFICSVRSFEEIPEQFIPRFEIIELPGYIEKEKIVISKRYLLPNLLKKHGLTKTELRFTVKALTKIIASYTQEAGLLVFSQNIEKICRKIALEKFKRPKSSWTINEQNLESYLGPALFIPEQAETAPEIGTAAGLAWTGAGGELMFIEGLKMKGSGEIITTGSLGEVMKESIQAAHSYVRSKADVLGIDFSDFNDFDIHIHFPCGAIPKDGPSAGITVCLVIASVMSERPIRNDIAMTGEVTLRGRVLRVAGIKEKISAAYRAGIYNVALPKGNQKDIKELPKEIIRKTKFTFIERVDELFEICLLDFTPSSYTLEKIFAEEIKKAKKKRKRSRLEKAERP